MTLIDVESNRSQISCIMVVAKSDWMRIQNLPNRIRCGVKKKQSPHTSDLQLMWTTLHLLILRKNSVYHCVGVKSPKNEIWKSWSWSWSGNLSKTVFRIRSGLFNVLNPAGLESWNPDPVHLC